MSSADSRWMDMGKLRRDDLLTFHLAHFNTKKRKSAITCLHSENRGRIRGDQKNKYPKIMAEGKE
jgi:hypothetical protein